jgi:CheY-like chemotaxis protein
VELGFAPAESRPIPAAQAAMQGRRVLIVDDNATQCRVLCLQAVTWGLVPRATTSPQEALLWIERGETFDLALIDQQMPELNGSDLIASIRRAVPIERLPILLLTPLGHIRPPAELGATATIVKPLKPATLHQLVFDALHGRTIARWANGAGPDENIARAHPLRVLLVEDNPVNQRVATLMLKKLGYTADVAGNGLEGVKAIEQQQYDVVLMDIQMPEMDGLQAAREICRRWPAGARPRIVAMTANASTSDREESIAAGMDGFISKPVRLQQLSEVLLASPPREHADLQMAK